MATIKDGFCSSVSRLKTGANGAGQVPPNPEFGQTLTEAASLGPDCVWQIMTFPMTVVTVFGALTIIRRDTWHQEDEDAHRMLGINFILPGTSTYKQPTSSFILHTPTHKLNLKRFYCTLLYTRLGRRNRRNSGVVGNSPLTFCTLLITLLSQKYLSRVIKIYFVKIIIGQFLITYRIIVHYNLLKLVNSII